MAPDFGGDFGNAVVAFFVAVAIFSFALGVGTGLFFAWLLSS